jgi:hypothetical protein
MLSYIFTRTSAVINIDGKTISVAATNPMYTEILEELKKGKNASESLILEMADILKAINCKVFGRVTVTADKVFYNNRPVGSALTERIIQMLSEGYDIEPWALFMDNVMLNPLETAREELYRFLESAAMPITPDGHFLAFKKVRHDLKSFYDGKTQHVIGKELSLPMNKVDTNYRNQCSSGLHFCNENYLNEYHAGEGVVLVVKINPKDVVAIPEDHNNAKGRAWKYVPIAIIGEKKDTSKVNFNKPVIGQVNGVNTFIDNENVPENPEKKGTYNGMTARQFMKEIKKAGGARPYARESSLPKSSVQDWVIKARHEIDL